jgi:large subunit ribosomal protein L13
MPIEYEESEIFKVQEARPKNIKKSIELGKMSRLLGSKFEA